MLRRVLLVFACLALAGAAGATLARPSGLSGVDAQRRARERDSAADRARAQDTEQEIARLRHELVALGEAENAGERTAGGRRTELIALASREAALKVKMGRNQTELSQLLGALQMYQRNPPPPLLVDARSARDAVRAAILIKAITPELERRSRIFAAQAEELNRIRRQAVLASGALLQAESDVADRRAQIQDLIEQKRALEQQLDVDAQAAETDVRRLASRARSMGELVKSLDQRPGSEPADAPLPARFVAPAVGRVAHRFGEKAPGRLRTEGWTWVTPPGAQVLSPAEARVDYAGPLKGWGLVVILRLNGEYRLVMAGLDETSAGVGQPVAAGEPVGRMADGRPGELYLELRKGASPVDPAPWLAGPLQGIRRG